MSFKVTDSDYTKILNYYDINIPKNNQELKKRAEDIIALKLCACIKKVGGPQNEARAIGICSRTVLKRKGLTRGKFKCRNGRNISFTKNKKGPLSIDRKTRRIRK
jgi:hypothetical protein